MNIPRIIITPGEPAGIGPDIVVKVAQLNWAAELIVVADPKLLTDRAQLLSLPLTLTPIDFQADINTHQPGQLKIFPTSVATAVTPGQLNVLNADYVLASLELATTACLQHHAAALVTGPVQKSIINAAKIPFSGHTEFLANRCGVAEAIMLFVIDKMKVALATTHIPLHAVANTITTEKLIALIQTLHHELKNKFGIREPRILVTGLNPHAGENGHMGQEEITIIAPALAALRAEQINVTGPLPADTIFTPKHLADADVIVAMYHDQALPVVKYIGFDRAVNVTLGLPIIRTSVDHGTALDVAGTNNADPGSLIAAIQLAIQLAEKKS